MATAYIILIFMAICGLYGYARLAKHNDKVYFAFAGGADEPHDSAWPVPTEERSMVFQLPDGKFDNTRNFHRVRISGTCMTPININNGEEWLAKKINPAKDLRKQVVAGDVLLIHLADIGRYQIRRVESFAADKSVNTYCYDADNSKCHSSNPHRADSIMGVLKYRLKEV